MERVVDKDCTIKITRKDEQIWFSTIPAGSRIRVVQDDGGNNKLMIVDKDANTLLGPSDWNNDIKVFLDNKELSLTSESPRTKKKVDENLNG